MAEGGDCGGYSIFSGDDLVVVVVLIVYFSGNSRDVLEMMKWLCFL